MNVKPILLIACLILVCHLSFGQENQEQEETPKGNLLDKVFVGGNFGLQFGTITFIDISPIVGYRFTDRFSAGPGITYRYLKFRGFSGTSTYGGSLFARHTIGSQFFAQAQYESLNTAFTTVVNQDIMIRRDWVSGFFLGGGIFQPLGRRGAVTLAAMYNLMYDAQRSPYGSPWVFNVGFNL